MALPLLLEKSGAARGSPMLRGLPHAISPRIESMDIGHTPRFNPALLSASTVALGGEGSGKGLGNYERPAAHHPLTPIPALKISLVRLHAIF